MENNSKPTGKKKKILRPPSPPEPLPQPGVLAAGGLAPTGQAEQEPQRPKRIIVDESQPAKRSIENLPHCCHELVRFGRAVAKQPQAAAEYYDASWCKHGCHVQAVADGLARVLAEMAKLKEE